MHRASVRGWSAHGATDDEEPEPDWTRFQRPDNEVPTSVGVDLLLGSSDDVAVFVCGLSVYRTGIEFTVEARASGRRDPGEEDDFLGSALHGHGRTQNRLLLGVEYADGRYGTNLGTGSRGVHLWSSGGGGGQREASATWFLSPLPSTGEVRLYCAWPSVGIDETVATLDGDEILSAAERVRELWPRMPESHEPREPRPVPVPEGGWFARHSGT